MQQVEKTAVPTLNQRYTTFFQAALFVLGFSLIFVIGWGGAAKKLRPYLRHIQIASGIFLIAIGLLLVTNRMTTIAIWAQQNGFYLDLPLGSASAPTYLIAILAGLLSFLSPCVLPLVPAYIGYLSGQAFGGTAVN